MAGQLACLRELTYFLAPQVNSYKRFVEGSFAPTAVAWGKDNRTCSLRVGRPRRRPAGREPAAGSGRQPLPGAAPRSSPSGLHGIDNELDPGDPL